MEDRLPLLQITSSTSRSRISSDPPLQYPLNTTPAQRKYPAEEIKEGKGNKPPGGQLHVDSLPYLDQPLSNTASQDDSWKYGILGAGPHHLRSLTSRLFNPRQQQWEVFLSGIPELICTAVLCLGLFGIYFVYSRKETLSKQEQLSYNWLTTIFYLLIPLSLSGGFRGLAKSYRWRLLSSTYMNIRKLDMVIGCDSLMTSFQLLVKGNGTGRLRPTHIQLFCATFLLLNLGFEVAVSGLGLVVVLDIAEAIDQSELGNVSVADFHDITSLPMDDRDLSFMLNSTFWNPGIYHPSFFANFYGNFFWPPWQILKSDDGRDEFCSSPEPRCDIRLQDAGIDANTQEIIMVNSSRRIGALATCEKHTFQRYSPKGEPVYYSLTDQYYQPGYITYNLNGRDETIAWNVPKQIGSYLVWAADFDYSRFNTPSTRSARVMAWLHNSPKSYIFDCNSTVFPMHGISKDRDVAITNEPLTLPDSIATIFAGAVGGKVKGSELESSDTKFYSRYPYALNDYRLAGYFNDSPTADDIALIIQTYALSAIYSFDLLGPRVPMSGYAPQRGQKLNVQWTLVVPILIGIPLAQFVVLCLTVYTSSTVIVRKDSNLATAHLLRPIVEKLGPHGCLMSGKDIAKYFEDVVVTYGVEQPQQKAGPSTYHVGLIEQSEDIAQNRRQGWRPGGMMPKGWYDGAVAKETICHSGSEHGYVHSLLMDRDLSHHGGRLKLKVE